jgi:hypothetical protein
MPPLPLRARNARARRLHHGEESRKGRDARAVRGGEVGTAPRCAQIRYRTKLMLLFQPPPGTSPRSFMIKAASWYRKRLRFAQIAGEERLYKASFRKVAEGSDTGIVNIYFQLNVQLIASIGLTIVLAVSHKHFCCNSLDFFVFWPRTCYFKVQTFEGWCDPGVKDQQDPSSSS